MDINLNDPNVDSTIGTPSNIPPAPPEAPPPGQTGTAPPIDSISASTEVGVTPGVGFDFLRLDRPLSIMDYARVVLDTIDNFRQEIYLMERVEAETMKKFHVAIAITALSLAELYLQFKNLSADMQAEANKQNTEINQQNTAINNYNQSYTNTEPQSGSDHDAIDQINWAIEEYNNGDMDEATFQSYVDDYNQYAEARNQSLSSANEAYNSQTGDYNKGAAENNNEIARFNILMELIGRDKIPAQQPLENAYSFPVLTPPYGVPVSTVNERENVGTIHNVPVPPTEDFIATYWGPIVESILPSLRELFEKLALAEAFAELQKFHFKGQVIALPDAFVQFTPAPLIAGTAGNHSIVAVGLSTIALGLQSKFLETVLSKALLEEVFKKFQFPLSGNIQDLLRFFTIEWLVQQGFIAGLQGLAILGKNQNNLDIAGTAFKLTTSLAFVGQIKNLIESGALVDIADKYLRTLLIGPADNQQIKEASQMIASALSISLIQFGLFQIASSLNLPGLIPQIFGNLTSHPALISALSVSVNTSFADVISNPISLVLIQASLIDKLVNSFGTDKSSAESLVREALQNSIGTTPYQSDFELRIGLVRGFQTAGLDQSTAEELANTALAFIDAEKERLGLFRNGASSNVIAEALLGYAPFGIISPSIITAAVTAGAGSIDSSFVRRETLEDSLFSILVNRGYDRTAAQHITDAAINSVLSVPTYVNEGILRESLRNALVRAGASPDDAIDMADKAIISQRSQIVEELFTSSLASILSIEQLRGAVAGEVLGRLAPIIGEGEAQNLTNRVIDLLFGNEIEDERRPLSIIRLLEDQITQWKNLTEDQHQDRLVENIREYLRPLVDLFALNERIMDPANTLILSMMTGMYSRPMPTNFQKTVDFLG